MSGNPTNTMFSEYKTNQLIRCSGCERVMDKNTMVTKKTEYYARAENTPRCEWDSYFCENCIPRRVEVRE